MADEPDTNNAAPEPTAPAPQAPATPAPQTVTLTVEEFEAKLNERAAQVRRAEQAKVKTQPETPKPKKSEDVQPQGLSADELNAMMSRRSAFDRALGKAGLEDEQVSILETLFNIEKPADPAEWVSRKSKAFGKAVTATPNPTPAPAPQAAPAPAPTQPAPTHPAPTGSSPPALHGTDPLKWSKSQRDAFLRSKASVPHDLHDRKNRAMWHEARKLYENAMATVRILPPDGE